MLHKIIDTHVHIWDLENIKYPWLDGDTTILNRSYAIDELEPARKEAGITNGVFVQAEDSFADADYMLAMCETTPWMVGAVCWLPLMDPVAMEKVLTEKYLKNKYFKGVRHLIHFDVNPKWLLQEKVLEGLNILVKYNLPYDVVGILDVHLETALKVAEKVPGLRMVIDHLNQPPISTNERFGRWGELMQEAARHKNFYAKISGLGTVTKKKENEWGEDDLKPYVEFTVQHFGEDRCFCGGDWPVSLLAGGYARTWKTYITLLEKLLSPAGQEKVLYTNAKQFYNL
jgi:Predicted metal-dependent hydrolase of the TIM-barrel fold